MRRAKKIFLWSSGSLAALLLLVLAFDLALSKLINLDAAKAKIVSIIHASTGCGADFDNLHLSIIPRPQVVLNNPIICQPGRVQLSMESLSITPKILPLLTGNLEIGRLLVVAPRVIYQLPANPPQLEGKETELEKKEQSRSSLPENVGKEIVRLLSPLSLTFPNLALSIRNGEAHFIAPDGKNLRFYDINTRIVLPPGKMKVSFSSQSTLWERLSVRGWLDTEDFSCKGSIKLEAFRAKELSDIFYPAARLRITDATTDLSVSFRGDGSDLFQANIVASTPEVSLNFNGKALALKGLRLKGAVKNNPEKLTVSIADLDLSSPRLKIAGDLAQDSSSRALSLDLTGTGLEVSPIRNMVLALFGENKKVAKIFQIVKGGWIPHITFKSHANDYKDLGKLENFVLTGHMLQGEIFTPAAELDLVETEGSVTIIQGILEGKDLKARTGNSTATNGVLAIGLDRDETDDAPFHLDLQLNADLAQLPPVLERVVKDADFQRELALIKDVKGKAIGRLLLGERFKDVKTRVEAREFTLQAFYERLPHAIELKGESFLYEGSHINAPVVSGSVGKSHLPRFSTLLDWGPKSFIKVSSAAPGAFSIDEIYPWLKTLERFQDELENFESLRGSLNTHTLDVEGPLLGPEKLRIAIEGTVENGSVQSKRLPEVVTIKSGGIAATREYISLVKCQAALLDASFSASGNVYFGKKAADLTFAGDAGLQANQSISDFINLPVSFRIRAPFSTPMSRIIWQENGAIQYFGDIKIPDGPQAFIKVDRNRKELMLQELSVKDQYSNASLSIKIKEKEPDLSFRGTLSSKSLNNLLAENRVLHGRINGDFKARLSVERPLESTIVGALELEGFQIPRKSSPPVQVERASIEGTKDNLFIQSATVGIGENRLDLKGAVRAVPKGLQVDVDISSGKLDWEKLGADSKEAKQGENAPGESRVQVSSPKAWESSRRIDFMGIPIEGVVRVKADNFLFSGYEWSPFRASVTLQKDETVVELLEAGLCGVSTPGTITFGQRNVDFNIKPAARNLALDPALGCLFGKEGLVDGTFELKGEIRGDDRSNNLAESLEGNIEFNAKEGRIYRFGFISKIFGLINFTEIYKGQIPDLINEGCAYNEIRSKAAIRDGILVLEETVIDSHCMKMVWSGDVDLVKKKVDLIVVVAPLRTVDSIINRIPVVGGMLNGTLISFPVRVRGDLADPDVTPLSPSAIGSEILDFMKRTLKSPLKLFQLQD